MAIPTLVGFLEDRYARYSTPEFLRSDPVAFLHEYDDPEEREVVALIAACLAYGRVSQIMLSVRGLLERMGWRPRRFLLGATDGAISRACAGFRHRFTGQSELAGLLRGAGKALREHGSLEACFCSCAGPHDETILPGLGGLVAELSGAANWIPHLLPSPRRGSACKRLCLFMRWMVRRDAVDPGGWTCVRPAQLIVPLDVHMRRICSTLGLTHRKSADLKAAIEATEAFRALCPEDPVRYDFALTRVSMYEGTEALQRWDAREHG